MRKWLMIIFGCGFIRFGGTALVDSCQYEPCRWTVTRNEEDSSTVVTDDESIHNINWRWDVRGGYWNVTYQYRYPSEFYAGRAVFVNCSFVQNRENAFVTWSSNEPWTSNAVLVHANAWNITYNGDIFGFVPTQFGRYIFKIFTKNKSHNPFGPNEQLYLPGGQCTYTSNGGSNDAEKNGAWWREQKARKVCAEPALVWNWPGRNGRWTALYRYLSRNKTTYGDVFYQRTDQKQSIKAITWELNESKQTANYASNPIRIYESAWRHTLSPAESWGFVPTGDGLWNFQIFSRNLLFEPFKALRVQTKINRTP